tara:strand:+ start:3384 stop:4229 length:846 start_codon:yes stop_codon:yes gene_type:complete
MATSDEVLKASYHDWASSNGMHPNVEQKAEIQRSILAKRVSVTEALRRDMHLNDTVIYQRLLRNADFLGIEGDKSQKIADALALGLHKSDELIQRRLVQRIEALGRAQAYPLPKIGDALLRARYTEKIDQWLDPPRLKIHHVYLSANNANIESKVDSLMKELQFSSIEDEQAYLLGDYFLFGNELPLTNMSRLTNIFGDKFTNTLVQLATSNSLPNEGNVWLGPLRSEYGVHFVKIISFEKATYRDFDDVKFTIQQDYVRELENEALTKYRNKLLSKYKVK